jgi:serine/threonine protein kinase
MRVMGPFEIDQPLARGGHATVHAARWAGTTSDSRTPELVAKIAFDGAELALHKENAALRAVEHPHVIAPVGFVDDATQAALVLPRAACSLRAHAARLDESEAMHVAFAVAGALDALHRAGFAHADVSAGNVLLLHDGTPVLSDLGSVQAATSAGAHADVAALARVLRDSLTDGESSRLGVLLADVERAPCAPAAFDDLLRALAIEPRSFDIGTAEPVVMEPPTIVVD